MPQKYIEYLQKGYNDTTFWMFFVGMKESSRESQISLHLPKHRLHHLLVHWLHGVELERLHHFERALFVLLEMVGFQVGLIDGVVGIDFEDADLARVGWALHRKSNH